MEDLFKKIIVETTSVDYTIFKSTTKRTEYHYKKYIFDLNIYSYYTMDGWMFFTNQDTKEQISFPITNIRSVYSFPTTNVSAEYYV